MSDKYTEIARAMSREEFCGPQGPAKYLPYSYKLAIWTAAQPKTAEQLVADEAAAATEQTRRKEIDAQAQRIRDEISWKRQN